jgi:hypothetical protein
MRKSKKDEDLAIWLFVCMLFRVPGAGDELAR